MSPCLKTSKLKKRASGKNHREFQNWDIGYSGMLVTPAAVSHGTLSVKVKEDTNIQGGDAVAVGDGAVANAGAQAVLIQKLLSMKKSKAFLFDAGVSTDLVDAINAVGATPSDLVAILESLREAGALNAELIVI